MEKVLVSYPFRRLTPPIELSEGFAAYDGNLKDKPGDPHRGIDYVLRRSGKFVTFNVNSAHDGVAFQGVSKTWGRWVMLRIIMSDRLFYDTIYAHLKGIPARIPELPHKDKVYYWPELVDDCPPGLVLKTGTYLGSAGTTGRTNRIIQLHFELQEVRNGERQKIDPYGLNLRFSSGKYPQPGFTLSGLPHYWTSDEPEFA